MASRDQLARTKIAGLKDGTVAIPDRHGVGVVGALGDGARKMDGHGRLEEVGWATVS